MVPPNRCGTDICGLSPLSTEKPGRSSARSKVKYAILGFGTLAWAWLIMLPSALAQTCAQGSSGVNCTIPAGQYTAPFSYSAGALGVDDSGTFNVQLNNSSNAALDVSTVGVNGLNSSTGNPGMGVQAGYLTVNLLSPGALTATGGDLNSNDNALQYQGYGLLAQTMAGNGGSYTNSDNKYNGANGASANNQLYVYNDQQILLQGAFAGGATAVEAEKIGGNGGSGAAGGSGGYGNLAVLQNFAPVSIGTAQTPSIGRVGAIGIEALSQGGNAGASNALDGTVSGAGGEAQILDTAPVSLYWALSSGESLGSDGIYGVLAFTQGGENPATTQEGRNGGPGGDSQQADITLTSGADITVLVSQASQELSGAGAQGILPPARFSAAVAALSLAGDGGLTEGDGGDLPDGDAAAGDGGHAGLFGVPTSVSIDGAQVTSSLTGVAAINAGGAGGSGNYFLVNGQAQGGYETDGGAGGSTYDVQISLTDQAAVKTNGASAPGIFAAALGGAGGAGATYANTFGHDAGNGGNAGSAGNATVSLTDSNVTTIGSASSPGIFALSQGGNGGNGGDRPAGNSGDAGAGGNAGWGNFVTVDVEGNAMISTAGDHSGGVVAASEGGAGGNGGDSNVNITASPRSGGQGGNSGLVTVTLGSSAAILTMGDNAPGLAAISTSGDGGNGNNSSNIFSSQAGPGGAGGTVGVYQGNDLVAVEATNNGTITTSGQNAAGLLAQARAGGGGGGGTAGGIFAESGNGGSAGPVGSLSATNSASGHITTAGEAAVGILAQSISGGGGDGGALDFANTGLGGSGGFNASSGAVTVADAGSIGTTGIDAFGILAQSIGGGGGAGAAADNLLSIGGAGGAGGSAQAVTVNLGGSIQTTGQLAAGVVAQSIGGGGGAGGNSTSTSAVISLAIGGNGGVAGNGAAATVNGTGLSINASGANALGIAAESAGGGGGIGGSAISITESAGFGAAVAVGGSGGAGGNGGPATVNLGTTSIMTGSSVQDAIDPASVPFGSVIAPLATDSYGVVALSVAGGGGIGGSSSAQAFVQDIPIPTEAGTTGVAISVTSAVGGSGGIAGTAGPASINLGANTSILTYGNGSHALLAQSLGGGGGDGGDSSAVSTAYGFKLDSKLIGQPNYNLDLAFSIGGAAGAASAGGDVTVKLGDSTAAPVRIATLGDYADGVFAQSAGGGGGNAGFGSGSTQNGTSSSTKLSMTLTLGHQGAGGGDGGAVDVEGLPGAEIQTYGDTSYGIFAQSVGGGGGASSGGSFALGLPSLNTVLPVIQMVSMNIPTSGGTLGKLNSNVSIKLGLAGAGGGDGGPVTVNLTGTKITTSAQAADGIFAQSVGGGGGAGGSAGSSGSSDDPTVIETLRAEKKFVNAITGYLADVNKAVQAGGGLSGALVSALDNFYPSLNLNISLGGSGGSGGAGKQVQMSLTNTSVATLGDYADAVLLQSTGGGGGAAGGAVAGGSSGLGSFMKLNANFALGATGGAGGKGGEVLATLAGTQLSTQGYAAYGIYAQSIGGGGGIVGSAETNSSGYVSLGAAGTTDASSGNNGGPVNVQFVTPGHETAAGGQSVVTTRGDLAAAVFLQSIGAGGGTAGDGFTLSPGISTFAPDIRLTAGGSGSAGDGGTVVFDSTQADMQLSTSGTAAYGILAQSVGGGGGVAFTQPGTAGQFKVGGTSGDTGNGGSVTVDPGAIAISTTGIGSYGIFAQSIGGGGGIAGFAGGAPMLYEATSANGNGTGNTDGTSGNGGDVSITTHYTNITTSGAGADGIFAQSVGAGGGLVAGADGQSLYAGSTGSYGSNGQGGLVTVNVNSDVVASGENAAGIFAQSTGQLTTLFPYESSSGGVNITVYDILRGGAGAQGWGIWIDTDWADGNTVTIGASGLVQSYANQAILTTGDGITTVNNYGTVEGAVNLLDGNPTEGTINNLGGGTFVPADFVNANVMNAGLLAPSLSNNYAVIPVHGNLAQTAGGVYAPNVQFATGQADLLTVSGNASLAGAIRPVTQSVLPRVSVPVLIVAGSASGTLTALNSPLFGYAVSARDITAGGVDPVEYSISNVSANFSPHGLPLNRLQGSVANTLYQVWSEGGGPAIGALFAQLDTLAGTDRTGYANALAGLAPQVGADFAARSLAGLRDFAGNLDGCAQSGNPERILYASGRCAWFQYNGNVTHQAGAEGTNGFSLNQITYAIGGETPVAPNLYLTGALAYQSSWLNSDDTTMKGNGDAGYAGAGLRYEQHNWSFTGGVFGSVGSYSTKRILSLLPHQPVIDGSPAINTAGVSIGAAYNIALGSAYIRPRITLDGIFVNLPGYTEAGNTAEAMQIHGTTQGSFVATPAVECGEQFALRPDLALHVSLLTGVSLQSNSNWTTSSSFANAPAGAGNIETMVPTDTAAARIGLGLRLVKDGRYSLRAQYNGAFSVHTSVNAGTIAFQAAF
jgi:hypothetical protein